MQAAGVLGVQVASALALKGCAERNSRGHFQVGFQPVKTLVSNGVLVPDGYRARVLAPWGQPLNDAVKAWQDDGSQSASDQANAVGMHHDGMAFFPLGTQSHEGLLCINHEYLDVYLLHGGSISRDTNTGLRNSVDQVRKEINAHGVSVVRVHKQNGEWQVALNDPHNRRLTGATPMSISGPLSGTAHLITRYSPTGTEARGTLNNCGSGKTPWGTYLTCEENWHNYFSYQSPNPLSEQLRRQGVLPASSSQYQWEQLAGHEDEIENEFGRFNITPGDGRPEDDHRNEANTFGYVVELDPYKADSIPVKRSALGRFHHEGAAVSKVEEGKPIAVYSGHDAQNEYAYKFVSDAVWNPADANPEDRLVVGAKYLDQGTLYVARFNDDGTGEWLPLTLESPTLEGGTLADTFDSVAAILLNAPGAADRVGATPMDRPEWNAVDPITGAVYLSLTNNAYRSTTNAANPRTYNLFGHIIRWQERDSVTAFDWDIFVFGGSPDLDDDINRSGLTMKNQFGGPDGLMFDDRGVLWIQTDNTSNIVSQAVNNQLLAVIPSKIPELDGTPAIISSHNQHFLQRVLVGPSGCEVTGLAFTPDYKTVFCNMQHPSNWPVSQDATEAPEVGSSVRARSAVVVIEREDGKEVGYEPIIPTA